METGTAVVHIRHDIGVFAKAFDHMRLDTFAGFTDQTFTTCMAAGTAVRRITVKRHALVATERRTLGADTPRIRAALTFKACIATRTAVLHIR